MQTRDLCLDCKGTSCARRAPQEGRRHRWRFLPSLVTPEKKKGAKKEEKKEEKAAEKEAEDKRKAAEKEAADKKKAADKEAEDKRKSSEKEAADKKKAADKEAADKKKAADKEAEDKRKAAEKEAEDKKKAGEKKPNPCQPRLLPRITAVRLPRTPRNAPTSWAMRSAALGQPSRPTPLGLRSGALLPRRSLGTDPHP